MPKLIIKKGPVYYSQKDEDAFFAWLQSVPGVVKVSGAGKGLQVTFRSHRISDNSLRDLLALHKRYKLRMKHLAGFESPKNSAWFRSPEAYWYKAVFGR